jgi:ribosomal protein S18 acetylase RimI-like enzyme
MSAQWTVSLARFYHTLLEDPAAHVLVAFDPGTVRTVGMAIGRILQLEGLEPPECGRIDDVWVEPEHRGHGVCRALIAQVLVFFERANIEAVTLDYTVGNREAAQVWSRFGFEPVLLVANAKCEDVKRRLGSSAP